MMALEAEPSFWHHIFNGTTIDIMTGGHGKLLLVILIYSGLWDLALRLGQPRQRPVFQGSDLLLGL
jgi:hypothetical protein